MTLEFWLQLRAHDYAKSSGVAEQNYDASNFTAGASGSLVQLFNLDAGPNSNSNIDPAGANTFQQSRRWLPSFDRQPVGHTHSSTRQVLPAVDAWNVTVQHQLTSSMSLEVSYVGSKGTHGFAGNGPNYDINPVAAGPGTSITRAFLIGADGKPDPTQPCPNGATPNPNSVTPGDCGAASFKGFSATQDSNARRPLCGTYDPIAKTCSGIGFDLGNYYGNDAASTYNAFEVKLDKRFAKGLQFLTHYTYAHANNYTDQYYAISHKDLPGGRWTSMSQVWGLSTRFTNAFRKELSVTPDSSRAF
jgi:hypothetical protein